MKRCLLALAAGIASATPLTAAAQAPQSDWSLTGNVGLVSEYRYRGISQTNRKPALQGGFDVGHASGFYVGNWNSSISWLSDAGGGAVSSQVEMDFYAGYKGEVAGFGYDIGGLYYYYPGRYPGGFNDPDTGEIYGAVTFGPVTGKLSYSVTDLFGVVDSKGSWYADLTAAYPVGPATLSAHIGRQKVDGPSDDACSYTDWRIGVAADAVGLSWSLDYIDTNAKGDPGQCYRNAFNRDLGKATLVVGVKKTF